MSPGGLGNLEEGIEVPTHSVVVQRRSTYLHTGGGIVDVEIHRAPDGVHWVTNRDIRDAIGRFDSLAAIDAAWTGSDYHECWIEDL